MSWGSGLVTATESSAPKRRSFRFALMAPILAGLVWAALNILAVWIHVDDPATADELSTFFLGIAVVVFGAIGFVIVLIPTLLGLWARNDASRLGWATFNAVTTAIGGGFWTWISVSNGDLEPGVLAAVRVSALALFAPAVVVLWAWRDWSQG